MALEVELIKEWLNALPNGARVGIDDGGLQLQTIDGQNWLEVGGLPTDEEEDDYEEPLRNWDGPPPYDAATATGMYDRGDSTE